MSTFDERQRSEASQIAALDLGSNSFHLLLVSLDNNQPRVVERLKEKVQLLGGARYGLIEEDAFARGLACIARFKQRLAAVPPRQIYVMGTFALRQAKNADQFIQQVGDILGSPLQVISGQREAELIFSAVAYGFGYQSAKAQQLVIDIGGGSTELALGRAGQSEIALSFDLGCVAYKDAFFNAAQSTDYESAKEAALAVLGQAELHSVRAALGSAEVIGTSGTIESIQTVLRANGWAWDTITADAMARVETAIADEQWLIEAGLPGLAPDRVDIFPAGVAILQACFEVLGLESVRYVDVSLLHGMIAEAIDVADIPLLRHDRAAQSIVELAERFVTDPHQAARVEKTALMLFQQTETWWPEVEPYRSWLSWAAKLHQLGVQVNPRHYHRHGAYVIKHAELIGFDEQERNILALLVRGHRRSLPGLAFQAFDPALAGTLLRLVALLRIAVVLERSHSDAESPSFEVHLDGNRLRIDFADSWLAAHPLSERELSIETKQLIHAGIALDVVDALTP